MKIAGASGRAARATDAELMRKGTRLHALQREVLANRQLRNLFLDRIKETNLMGNMQIANARVVDPAVPAVRPAKPRKKLIIGLSGLVALFVGVMLAFMLDSLDNTFKTGLEVERKLRLPTLGIVPQLRTEELNGVRPESAYLSAKAPRFAESIRTVRTGVSLFAVDRPKRIFLVTSAVQGEGKTTVALNLACALSQTDNKTLLIDADMRKPAVARGIGLEGDAKGLAELTAGTARMQQCIHKSGMPGLDVVPAGVVPPNPQELLSSERFADLLERLSGRYKSIVLDSPPTQEVSDALLLATRATGVVFVVEGDATPDRVVEDGIKQLQGAGAAVIGVVLNRVDLKKAARWYGYGKYTGYYHYRGYGQG